MSNAAAAPAETERLKLRPRATDVRRPWGTIIAFLLPALTIYAVFTAYPVARTFYNSVHKVLPGQDTWVGLANYEALLNDEIFWRAVSNTVVWSLASPVIEVSIALLLALALYAKVPGARFFRIAWFTPVLMSYVVVGILWVWIYNYDWGPVNVALRTIGLGGLAQAWLGNPNTALPALIVVTSWMWTGFNMVVLLAALHSLPREVIEAAELDNCNWGHKLVYIIFPLVRPTVLNLLVLSFIGKMKIFDLVWIMTKGGPLWSTETVSTYLYKRAFDWSTFDLGYPSMLASVWFVIVLVAVLAFTRAFRLRDKLEF
jgi:multiple sugar transport system permease protein/raffinose/stachyose/melibiose transport system permease protein